MKRDIELLREILLFVEAQDPNDARIPDIEIAGYTDHEVCDHVHVLEGAGWLRGVGYTLEPHSTAVGLTMSGHDFLDAIRNDTVWRRLMKTVAEKGGGIPLDLAKALAIGYMKELLGLSPGGTD
jgi:hypothetical protein